MFDIQVGVPKDEDFELLERWRRDFSAASLELPEGYASDGVATAVARRADSTLIGSLTASICTAVSLDPLLRNPDAGRKEVFAGLFALTRTLEYQAQLNGARSAYVAIPNLLGEYQELIQKCGFKETAQHCRIFRHSFT